MKTYTHKTKKPLFTLLLLFVGIMLITCEKIDRDNPWDEKADLDPNSWAPHSFEIEVVSITERELTWHYGEHNIEGFEIDRKEGDGEWEATFVTLEKDARSWKDTEIVPDASLTYSYRVYAFAGSNESSKITLTFDSEFPAPSNLEISINSVSSVSLSWDDNSTGEEGFKIDRRFGDYDWEIGYALVSVNETSYTDNNVDLEANHYQYKVYAYSGGYYSDYAEAEYIPLEVTTNEPTNITPTSATSGGYVFGSHVDSRGIAYGTSPNPDISGNTVPTGSGAGSFTAEMTELTPETEYFVRAYASNSLGTTYGNEVMFETAPTYDDDTEVVDVLNPATGKTWMDRNLGASRTATSSTDEEAYGDLYQWGRASDGHQKRNSGTMSTLSSTDFPGHGNFITVNSSPYDWRSPQNDNLWQGVNGVNNPCPPGYRLPTEAELNAERQSWSSNNSAGAFASPLKLPVAGYRFYSSGSLYAVGSLGYYWSSTVDGSYSRYLYFRSTGANTYSGYRAGGVSVRCLKDE